MEKLFAEAVRAAENAAGGRRAFMIIGDTFRRALIAQELLGILFRQDEDAVPDARVRELLNDFSIKLMDYDTEEN